MAKVIKLKTTKPGFNASSSNSSKKTSSGGGDKGPPKRGKFGQDKKFGNQDRGNYNKSDNRNQDNKNSRGAASGSGSKDKKDSKGESFLSMLHSGQFSSEAIKIIHETGLDVEMAVTAAGYKQPGRISKCTAAWPIVVLYLIYILQTQYKFKLLNLRI